VSNVYVKLYKFINLIQYQRILSSFSQNLFKKLFQLAPPFCPDPHSVYAKDVLDIEQVIYFLRVHNIEMIFEVR